MVLNLRLCDNISERASTVDVIRMLTISQETRKHELGTVADSVNRAVLDNQTLVGSQKSLQRRDDLPEVGLVASVVHGPLGVEDVVQSDELLLLVHSTGTHTTEFLHMSTNAKEKTKVNTEGTDVGTSLAADPEHAKVTVIVELDELALVDGSDTELTLDGRDQRRTLEEGTGEGLEGAGELRLAARNLVVKSDNANVLLSGTLLGLDETSGTIDTNDEAASDLGIESSTVTGLLATRHSISMCHTRERDQFAGLGS